MTGYRIQCTNPGCGKALRVPEAALGRRVMCPACRQPVRVPGSVQELQRLEAQAQPRLHVEEGPAFAGMDLVLDPERAYTCGRADDCNLQLPGPTVSRRHFSLHWVNNHWVLEDLNTTTGTLIDELPVVKKELVGGECIRIGGYKLRYLAPGVKLQDHRGGGHVVIPAGRAAPLPVQSESAAAPAGAVDATQEQRLREARGFSLFTPEHLKAVSARDQKRYTRLLMLKLGGVTVVLVGIVLLVTRAIERRWRKGALPPPQPKAAE